ncbi:hypothetical protein M0Q97_01425 [Candidatus Dojkabacteria bacterium]|jgi:hypothetical protein|nr:hypothetical protein [Candidatus Dojkabacteria bacterium]
MNDLLINGFNITDDGIKDFLQQQFDIAETHDRKFVETYKVKDYEIFTDGGWQDIYAIGKTIPYNIWKINTKDFELKCADKHLVFDEFMYTVYVEQLKSGDKIQTIKGLQEIISVENFEEKVSMYDLELDYKTNRRFYTNGILSHNSMWMQNIAVKAADQGANVVYVTLEMGSQKCMKRMGSMRLKIPADEYNEKSKDTIFMKNRINSLKNMNNGLFNSKPGKIFVKKYNTSDCTVTDLDNYIHKLETSKGIKINMILVDYINIMSIEKGLDFANMLFLKGKHLAEGLRYIADKHNCCVITATQTDKSVWGANDIDLKNMPESKAIAETADSVWAIIRNPEMKKNNIYRLKILKLRDGEHSGEQIRFDFNTKFLVMENDELVGTV